jgi:hypothetical protein
MNSTNNQAFRSGDFSWNNIMKDFLIGPGRRMVLAFGLVVAGYLPAMASDVVSGELHIKSVQGTATYSMDHLAWAGLKAGMDLGKGAELKTGPGSTADLEFEYSGTVLRLRPDSSLELSRLDEEVVEANVITETRLNLKSGSLIGSQRKLSKPSTFTIMTPNGSATIRGTEYLVTAGGAVSCFRGEVAVDASRQGSPVNAKVPAGFSFNPGTCQVAATAPDKFTNFGRDVQAVRDDADKLGFDRDNHGGEPECEVSPVKGQHDHDHDHDDGHDHDHGDDHDHGGDHGEGYNH